jgi:hypothetical protein
LDIGHLSRARTSATASVPGSISAQKSYSTVVNSDLTPAKIAALVAGPDPPVRRMMRDSTAPRHRPNAIVIIQCGQSLGLCSCIRYL